MRLAISNIAWQTDEEPTIAASLQTLGVRAVEVAPAKVSAAGVDSSFAQATAYRRFWADYGINVVAMQALLFGATQPLHLFQSAVTRQALHDHLCKVFDLGAALGVQHYVFGSPKNRDKGPRSLQEAMAESAPFWQSIGDEVQQRGGYLLLEPNPPVYGGDFIQTTEEAIAYVNYIAHPHIGWHADAGTIANNDDPATLFQGETVRHYHLSALNLEPVYEANRTEYERQISILRQLGYDGHVSIEMKSKPGGESNLHHVEQAITFAQGLL